MEPNSYNNGNQFTPNQTPISPDKKEGHSKLKVVLIIIGLIILLGLAWWLIPSKPNKITLTPEQKEALLQELSKTTVSVTDKQQEAILKDLSKSTVTITPEQREALLKELNN